MVLESHVNKAKKNYTFVSGYPTDPSKSLRVKKIYGQISQNTFPWPPFWTLGRRPGPLNTENRPEMRETGRKCGPIRQ